MKRGKADLNTRVSAGLKTRLRNEVDKVEKILGRSGDGYCFNQSEHFNGWFVHESAWLAFCRHALINPIESVADSGPVVECLDQRSAARDQSVSFALIIGNSENGLGQLLIGICDCNVFFVAHF